MAQARATLGTVLNVIGSTANTAISALDNINAGMEIISMHVEKYRAEQAVEVKFNLHETTQRLVQEYGQQRVIREEEAVKFCAKSQFRAERYAIACAEFSALLES